jgi:hypothetical protein
MARTLQRGLTPAQARLLEQHRRGLVRLVQTLCDRRGCEPGELVVLLAHKASRPGRALCGHVDLTTRNDSLVVPGLARELPAWTAQLALSGPVYDCTTSSEGVAVIVIDEHGDMALCRVAGEGTAVGSGVQNRPVIPRG